MPFGATTPRKRGGGRAFVRVIPYSTSAPALDSQHWTSPSPSDSSGFARGINSFQLFNDGKRWRVVTIYWDAERPGNPIPDKYLKRD